MVQPIQRDEALLQDLLQADGEGLHLWWLGRTSFLLKQAGRLLALDLSLSAPSGDEGSSHERVLDPARLDFVTAAACTQGGAEQLHPPTLVSLKRASAGDLRLVVPCGIRELASEALLRDPPEFLYADENLTVNLEGFHLTGIASSPGGGIQRDELGRCTALGYVISAGGFRLFHSSQTTWHLGLTQTLQELGPFDLMLLPISSPEEGGGQPPLLTGADAASLAKVCGCGIAVPSYGEQPESVGRFRETCQRLGQDFEILAPGERLTIERETA